MFTLFIGFLLFNHHQIVLLISLNFVSHMLATHFLSKSLSSTEKQ